MIEKTTMINFTPPIKVSLLVALVYLIGLQIFLHNANYMWLLPANLLFGITSSLYIRYLNKIDSSLSIGQLTAKGIRLSLLSSLLCIAAAVMSIMVSIYFLPGSLLQFQSARQGREIFTLIFTNGLLVNMVCGGVAAFITAGVLNEQKHHITARHLPSVNSK